MRQEARPKLAPYQSFRYRAATRVDTLGGNAEEGRRNGGFRRFRQGTPAANAPANAKGKAMSNQAYELKAEARERVGKGSARDVRRNGKVPAVIYGDKQPPLAIALSYKEVF